MKTSEQIDKLAEALAKAQGQMSNPEKNRTAKIPMKAGGSYEYNYADLPSTIDTVRKALSDNGLSHTCSLTMEESGMCLCARLMHASGQWIESEYPLPYNLDEKTLAAKITYGRRYLFTAQVGVAADEDYDDVPAHEDAKYPQRALTPQPAPVRQTVLQPKPAPIQESPLSALSRLVKQKGLVQEAQAYIQMMFGIGDSTQLSAQQIAQTMNAILNGTLSSAAESDVDLPKKTEKEELKKSVDELIARSKAKAGLPQTNTFQDYPSGGPLK